MCVKIIDHCLNNNSHHQVLSLRLIASSRHVSRVTVSGVTRHAVTRCKWSRYVNTHTDTDVVSLVFCPGVIRHNQTADTPLQISSKTHSLPLAPAVVGAGCCCHCCGGGVSGVVLLWMLVRPGCSGWAAHTRAGTSCTVLRQHCHRHHRPHCTMFSREGAW